MKKTVKNTVVAGILLILPIAAVFGIVDNVLDTAIMGRVHAVNAAYLEKSFDKSVKGFLVLSTIKAGLAIVEGSESRIGFSLGAQGSVELQYGDVVQSMYDYVDIAWKTSLAGGAVLLLTGLLLDTVAQIDQWFLAAALSAFFICHMLSCCAPRLRSCNLISKHVFSLCIVATAVLYLVLPLTVLAASFLSSRISAPLIAEATLGYESVENDLSSEAITKRLSSFDDTTDTERGFWDKMNVSRQMEHFRQAFDETIAWLKSRMQNMALWTIKLFAGYLFDCLVFPLAIFSVLFVVTKGLLAYVFGIRRDNALKEDIAALVGRYRREDGIHGERGRH